VFQAAKACERTSDAWDCACPQIQRVGRFLSDERANLGGHGLIKGRKPAEGNKLQFLATMGTEEDTTASVSSEGPRKSGWSGGR
jgi:hypothetical protein